MGRQTTPPAGERTRIVPQATEARTEPAEAETTPEDRRGMRGHDEHGNVRPADGRYGLHHPSEESQVSETGDPDLQAG